MSYRSGSVSSDNSIPGRYNETDNGAVSMPGVVVFYMAAVRNSGCILIRVRFGRFPTVVAMLEIN